MRNFWNWLVVASTVAGCAFLYIDSWKAIDIWEKLILGSLSGYCLAVQIETAIKERAK